jgi:hypothetical protein
MKKKLVRTVAALLLPIWIVMAVDVPDVKEGLWSIKRHTIDNPGNKISDSSSTLCRNHAYDRHAFAELKKLKGCTTISENIQGNRYSLEMSCAIAGATLVTKGVTIFDPDTAVHSENHATYTPALAGISETTMIIDQKYLGACPAGIQPGDMTTADGKVLHLWKH